MYLCRQGADYSTGTVVNMDINKVKIRVSKQTCRQTERQIEAQASGEWRDEDRHVGRQLDTVRRGDR